MTRIYTRTGDAGETGLIGGRRVPKDHARVEAYGALDELNSALGAARAFLQDQEIGALLEGIQRDLFALGAEVAAPGDAANVPHATAAQVEALEQEIDRFDAALPPLRAFILPGGTPAGSLLHLARTVNRRAERRLIALGRSEVELPPKPGIPPRPDSFIHAMPAYVRSSDIAGLKWISGFPDNPSRGLPYISGLMILNDPATGVPLAVMDASWITAVRTGAGTAVAAKYLARREATHLAFIGCGVQARSHLDAVGVGRPGTDRPGPPDPQAPRAGLARGVAAAGGVPLHARLRLLRHSGGLRGRGRPLLRRCGAVGFLPAGRLLPRRARPDR